MKHVISQFVLRSSNTCNACLLNDCRVKVTAFACFSTLNTICRHQLRSKCQICPLVEEAKIYTGMQSFVCFTLNLLYDKYSLLLTSLWLSDEIFNKNQFSYLFLYAKHVFKSKQRWLKANRLLSLKSRYIRILHSV